MTSREIMKALLAKEIPERAGLNEHFWPHIIENAWGEQGITEGNWVQRFNLDEVGMCWCCMPEPRADLCAVVEEDEEHITHRSGWGATFRNWKHKAGTPEHIAFMIEEREVWDREFREAVLATDMKDHVDLEDMTRRYNDLMAGDRFVVYSGTFVVEEMRRIMGDVAMLESLLEDPDFIHDFCQVCLKKHLEYYSYVIETVGRPDGMHIYEDLGYTQGAFFSPTCFSELILPYYKQFFGFFRDHKLPIIFHTCGDYRPHLPMIVENDLVDCIQANEAKTGMDVVEMAREYKDKLCFMGNIDIRALESGNRDRIREECLYKLRGMIDQRAPYVYMSDHSIPPSVTVKDYECMLELFWENCRY